MTRVPAAATVAAALAWWTNRGIGFEPAPTAGVWLGLTVAVLGALALIDRAVEQ